MGDPNHTRWSSAKKIQKLNEAQERFVIDTRCLVDTATDNLVDGTAEYSLPTDVLDLNRVAINDGTAWIELQRKSMFYLDFYSSSGHSADTGTPSAYYVDLDPDNKKLHLYPIPGSGDAGTANLKFEYVKIPAALSSDSSTPFGGHTLLSPYHMAVAYEAARQILLQDPGVKMNPQEAGYVQGNMEREYSRLVSSCVDKFRAMGEEKPLRWVGGRYYRGR